MFAGHRFVVAAAGLDDEDVTLIRSQIVQHGGEMLGQQYTPQVKPPLFRLPRSHTDCPSHCLRLVHHAVASCGPATWAEPLPSRWQCTHVLVVSNKVPEVERARADGRCVVTDYWLEACVKKGALQPTSIPGFEKLLCVPSCLPPLGPLPATVDAWTHRRAECGQPLAPTPIP